MSTNKDMNALDATLKKRLSQRLRKNSDYWACRNDAARLHTHAFFQYPAMMVPQVQNRLIREIHALDPTVSSIFDPYVGSGTTLCEALLLGMSFRGHDINPMAILLCQAKSGPFRECEILEGIERLFEKMEADDSTTVAIDMTYLQKWFREDVALALSRIRRAICADPETWRRQFFWIALAETIRTSSNSRTSTVKLHKREDSDIVRELDPIATFRGNVIHNAHRLLEQKQVMMAENLVNQDGTYKKDIRVLYGDSIKLTHQASEPVYDLLVTSPPYGDNKTTVTYGQHSYLPLNWIDLDDIGQGVTSECLATTATIDSASLGGSIEGALNHVKPLGTKSSTLKRLFQKLSDQPDPLKRVAAFFRDFDSSLGPILSYLRPDGYMVWTVGNRTVGGEVVPFNRILRELLTKRGAHFVMEINRSIHNKRHARKNAYAETMDDEQIVILRKGP